MSEIKLKSGSGLKVTNSEGVEILEIHEDGTIDGISSASINTTTGSETVSVDGSTLNVVTRDTQQTISGKKTFTTDVEIENSKINISGIGGIGVSLKNGNNEHFAISDTDLGKFIIEHGVAAGTSYSLYFPLSDGTVATEGYVTAGLQDVREVAEGKCKSIVISVAKTAPTTDAQARSYKKLDGTSFTSLIDFTTYIAELVSDVLVPGVLKNSLFDDQANSISLNVNGSYLIDESGIVRIHSENFGLKTGDVIFVTKVEVPDRWFSLTQQYAYVLETTKINLDSYVLANPSITGATKCKITYDSKGLVTSGANLAASDIPNLDANKITSGTFDDSRIASASTWNAKYDKPSGGIPASDLAQTYVIANTAITGATKCKITYDSKGLVTSSDNLSENDIPNLDASKITSGTFADARIASASTWNAKYDKPVGGIPVGDLHLVAGTGISIDSQTDTISATGQGDTSKVATNVSSYTFAAGTSYLIKLIPTVASGSAPAHPYITINNVNYYGTFYFTHNSYEVRIQAGTGVQVQAGDNYVAFIGGQKIEWAGTPGSTGALRDMIAISLTLSVVDGTMDIYELD